MTVRSGFFNSINGDRIYHTGQWAEYFSSFIGNGIFPNPSNNLQVASNNNMTIMVKAGKAWINGYILINDSDYQLSLTPADGVLNRIDRIVARYDTVDREIRLEVKKGAFASNPVAPTLQRDADGYELAIADIRINAGVISITQANITDTRLNSDLCGIVHGVVEQVDATAIFNQFESWYAQTKTDYDADIATWTQEKKDTFDEWYTTNVGEFISRFDTWFSSNTTNWDSEFIAWFDSIRGQLEGDIAANLASQVTDLQNNKADKTELAVVQQDLSSHLADNMPHRMIDSVTGKTFKYGIAIRDGEMGILYEEVL